MRAVLDLHERADERHLRPVPHRHDVEHAIGVAGTGGDLHPGPEVRDVGDDDRVAAEFEPVPAPVRARGLDQEHGGFPADQRPERRDCRRVARG